VSELVSNSLFVSLIDDYDNGLGHCYFVLNNSSPLKFYTNTKKITYTPEIL
jgi:hypothetical protein